MSFILDALKKAESERNRRVAPVLMDARIAPPRRGLPAWAWVLGVALLVNLALLAWLALRQPAAAPPAAVQAAEVDQAASLPTPAASSPSPAPSAGQGPAADAAPATGAARMPGDTPPATASALPRAAPAPTAAAPAADYSDEDQLPGIHELRAAGVPLPELQLLLHVYDPAPSHRSVLLNGQRVREGEFMANGVKVERITPQGVVLEASGRRFRLVAGD